ncbi:BMP family ABC transporter substrate-binding protein [Candidatus Pacearchaeota archaeon]|nr:BMP family ABC transporter substrate-binding protein [Candidatus Pacearchaeota archaeon]
MNKKLGTIFLLIVITLSSQIGSSSIITVNDPLEKIAIIIDSPEFYHSSFVDDVLNGFSMINQTYQIDFDVYQLTDFSLTSTIPLQFTYRYNGSITNHTKLTIELIETNEYDLIVLMGYMLRYNFLNFSVYPDMNFLFYDLSGEQPAFEGGVIPNNLYLVGFQENETGFLAGSLVVDEFYPLPKKIAIVTTGNLEWNWDPRSIRLIAGFQAAIFRNTTNIDIQINYIDRPNIYFDFEKARSIGYDLASQGFKLVFSGFQANHTLEIIETFTGGNVVCVDLNQSMSVMKNNSYVLMDVFSDFNKSQGFIGGVSALYGITDGVFYGHGWINPAMVNNIITGLAEEIASQELVIPTRIKEASNTPSFNYFIAFIVLIIIPFIRKKAYKRN